MSTDHAAAAVRLLGDAEKLGAPFCERLLQAAQVQATLALAEQQKIGNKIAVATLEQLGELARCAAPPQYARDPAVDNIGCLSRDEWERLGL